MVLTTESFTVTLPSNSNLDTHRNTPSDYTVQLRTPKDLVGAKWEAALLSIHYPINWSNVSHDIIVRAFFHEKDIPRNKLRVIVHNGKEYPNDMSLMVDGRKLDCVYCILTIPAGYYNSIAEIGERIASALRTMYNSQLVAQPPIEYIYDVAHSRGRFVLTRGDLIIVLHEEYLAQLLGHDATLMECPVTDVPPNTVVTARQYIMSTDAYSPPSLIITDALYVYCDFIEDQAIGDADAQLLGIVPKMGQYGQRNFWTFVPPNYFPVSKRQLTTLSIRIRDDKGYPIQFARRSANVVCSVSFRPCVTGI